MKVKRLSFVESEDGATPSRIVVELTIEEALWIAKIAGGQRGTSPHTAIYSCLVDSVFNRFWDDGVADALRTHPVETPPIRYEV
jgi:hypothetical protein